MNATLTQTVAAIAMAGTAFALFYMYRRYLATNSERRMRAMLESVGLDPEIATNGDVQAIMKDVRQRCRSCTTEDVCERWLTGHEGGKNDFCPNSRVFEELKKYSSAAG
jgi:uncharacterized protein DUF6455